MPTSASASVSGGGASFAINTKSTCAWTAAPNVSWLHVNTTSGTGSNTVNYTVDSNDSTARSGTITAGGQTFTVNQAGIPPTLASGLDTTNLVWTTDATYPWQVITDVTHDGVDAAVSGNKFVADSISWLQTTVVGPGTIGFWWKVDSDVTTNSSGDGLYSYDDLQFLIDDNLQDHILGQVGWNYREFPIDVGSHTLGWQYVKDAQFNTGNDSGWLDQVSWSPGQPISLAEALDTCGIEWSSDGTIPTLWSGQTNVTHDGKSAARSGTIYLSQETWMQSVVSGVSNISFWWKVSSQTNFDFLEFYTNDILAKRISGEVNWQSNFFNLPATNTVTLKWRYAMTNGIYTTMGTNAGWVDQVVFGPVLTAAPIITLLGSNPATVECHGTFTDPGATAQDACSGAPLNISTNGAVNLNVVGAYFITYVATNSSGVSTTNSRTVNVVDTTPPQVTLNGTSPVTIECHGTFIDLGASASDVCAGPLPVTTNSNVNLNAVGSYNIEYVATDPSGNSATNSRAVNVVDTTPPQITLNGTNPMTVECHGTFTDPGASASDTCAGALLVTTNSTVNPDTVGSYTVTYIATDPSGNSATNTRTVNVVDTTPPVISYCFTNLTLSVGASCTAILPDLTGTNYILAADACSSVTVTQAPAANVILSPGTNAVVLTAYDVSGNTVSCTNTVTVIDSLAPSLVPPANLQVNADLGQCSSTNLQLGTPTVSDNCGTVTVTNNSTGVFSIGTNLIIWTAIDDKGNSTNSLQKVVVVDNQPPAIAAPALVSVFTDLNTNIATGVNLGTPTASDNCGIGAVTNDAPTFFPLGTNTVTWSATDVNGNTNSATQQVVVNSRPNGPHRITSIVRSGGGTCTLSFTGTPNVVYFIQASSNLLTWINVHTNTAAPDGTWTYIDSSSPSTPRLFFRSQQP